MCVGAGEPLADGLDVALLDGVGVAWLDPGEGVAVAEAVGAAPPFAGPADEVVVAIVIPATIATTPVMTPTASSTRVQVEAGAAPDVGPSPVMRCLSGLGCDGRGAVGAVTREQEYLGCPGLRFTARVPLCRWRSRRRLRQGRAHRPAELSTDRGRLHDLYT